MNKWEKSNGFSVLIPDGESRFALTVVRCLGQIKNIRIIILSSDPWPLIRFSRYTFRFLKYKNKMGEEGRLKVIYNTIKELKPDVVLPVDIPTIRLISENWSLLSKLASIAPLPKTDALEISNNKWLLSGWLKDNNIPCPPTTLLKSDNAWEDNISPVPFPALIKPPLGSGGEGIEYLKNVTSLFNLCNKNQSFDELILQTFIKGYDIDCSILCKKGEILAYTIQKVFVQGSVHFRRAAGIDFFHDSKTFGVVKDLAEKFNWTGIVHIDLRYDEEEKQVKVIEMNPRFWGSLIGSLCAGVNFPYLACLIALGREIPKIELMPIRYVQGNAAIKIMAQRMMKKNKENAYFDHSVIKFLLKDPIPNIYGKCSGIYKNLNLKRK